ncbi:MAG: polyphosphate kinase 1 [Myxococcales bacterium]
MLREPESQVRPAAVVEPPQSTPSKLPPPPLDPGLYINRELSWLAFNGRVLAEALDPAHPLLERLKFLAIHASNLDEFFMVRVSGLHEQLEATVLENTPDGLSPGEQLKRIREIVDAQLREAYSVLSGELLPSLRQNGIWIADWKDLDEQTRAHASEYFRTQVFPVLTPLAVDLAHPFPFLSNLSLSLAVEVRDPDTGEWKFARVKVPESLPRFVPVDALGKGRVSQIPGGSVQRFLPLEQLIAQNVNQLFPELEILGCHPFRVTRDTDIDILVEEAEDLMSVIDREIRRRRFGACVRLEVHHRIPARVRKLLREKLEIDDEDVYESVGLLELNALMSLASIDRPDLRDPPFAPRLPQALADAGSTFTAVRASDILLHHPYDSFASVLDFLEQAATDPNVLAIKMTLYRAGSNAEAVRRLIRAAENGKQVAVSIELKARFDEENNMVWARAMERAGVHVFYGGAGMKTHAKMALVVRREKDALQRYVHLSTGNYNASTARLYTDIALFTANTEIGEDVSELFNALSGVSKQTRYRKLSVAPTGLAEAVLAQIGEQTRRALEGLPARIYGKMNSLVEVNVIRALYDASAAGVQIDLVVRGICCLKPGVPGVSENIRVRSIVGRFLEHERLFVFGEGASEKMFVSSADWMPRNFYRRVEVMFPIESEALRSQIRKEVIEPSLTDDVRHYALDANGEYTRISRRGEEALPCMQTRLLEASAADPARRVPFSRS